MNAIQQIENGLTRLESNAAAISGAVFTETRTSLGKRTWTNEATSVSPVQNRMGTGSVGTGPETDTLTRTAPAAPTTTSRLSLTSRGSPRNEVTGGRISERSIRAVSTRNETRAQRAPISRAFMR